LKFSDDILIYDLEPDAAKLVVEKSDVIFCLDFNDLDRIDKLGDEVELNTKATKVLIDHHLFPGKFPDLVFHDTEASSTSELVYQVIEELGMENKIDPFIGEALFTGLITDTGSFKYSTRAYTYHVAAKLKEAGVDDYFLQDRIFNSLSTKNLELLGFCLGKRMKVMEEHSAAYIYLTREDYKYFNIQRGDTEGIVNYLLMMSKIKVAAFITEQPTIVKISLRSKGEINVQEMATKHFNGGGHKNASGGGIYASLKDIIKRFEKEVKNLNLK
jgi:phosphoesterase RecJ-like protein